MQEIWLTTTIAVNPELIPYGSEIHILYPDGTIEVGQALDTGGAMRKTGVKKIDVFRQTHEEAIRHGVRKAIILYERSLEDGKTRTASNIL
jgi:3D (Asp-Asp-Asp) domain-containing protein